MIPGSRTAGKASAATLSLALASIVALAGSNSTTLPNGAELSVSVVTPETGDELQVPVGQATIDVPVTGSASVGVGEVSAAIIYTIDLSGSTGQQSGSACGTFLQCEQAFFLALNTAVIGGGSVNQVGVVGFGTSAAIADVDPGEADRAITGPADDEDMNGNVDVEEVLASTTNSPQGRIVEFTLREVGAGTNCVAALVASRNAAVLTTASTRMVVFASDGICNAGGQPAFNNAVSQLSAAGVVVNSIAIGQNSSCTTNQNNGSLQQMADGTGGQCFDVPDPGDLPSIIPALIGSSLDQLSIAIDGGPSNAIPDGEISLPLPADGPVTVDYATTAPGLGPGDHTICVTAHGSTVSGDMGSVEQCETIHLLQLEATPPTATNDLGNGDDTHTVTATILGDAAQVGGRLVSFSVSGQNAGATGTCSPNPDCTTDATGSVSFTYQVPLAGSSLGDDVITVSTAIGGETAEIDLAKEWVDTTPPTASCQASVNPSGKNIPRASRQNEDGFYLVDGQDLLSSVEVFVVDQGSGTVFGPFAPGATVKYTQAGGAPPSMKPMGSSKGKASAVTAHITGNGDGAVFAVDGSGNASDPVACLLVPRPPK